MLFVNCCIQKERGVRGHVPELSQSVCFGCPYKKCFNNRQREFNIQQQNQHEKCEISPHNYYAHLCLSHMFSLMLLPLILTPRNANIHKTFLLLPPLKSTHFLPHIIHLIRKHQTVHKPVLFVVQNGIKIKLIM